MTKLSHLALAVLSPACLASPPVQSQEPAPARESVAAESKPNIVLAFLDNFGWGEPGFNGGGIIRGTPTPRMDSIASDGLKLTNFNVEVQCTPSRSALMTGRYAIRSGNAKVPVAGGLYGLVQWEHTLP